MQLHVTLYCAVLSVLCVLAVCRSSRLHFIGSWKSRVEALMADHHEQQQQLPGSAAAAAGGGQHPLMLAAAANSAASKRSKAAAAAASGGAAQRRVVVHIDMDCFFAAVAAVGRPEFAGWCEVFLGRGHMWLFIWGYVGSNGVCG